MLNQSLVKFFNMKKLILSLVCFFSLTSAFSQKVPALNLNECVIISHLDKSEDRFSLEINTSEVLSSVKVKNMVSLNVLKQGGDPQVFLTDSIVNLLKEKGFNTLMLVSIRGYDKNFKQSTATMTLAEDLSADNLFPIYKEDIVSVTFEFHFYRDGKLIYTDLLKISGVGSRDKVLKKYRKKLAKRVYKKWK